MQHTDGQLGTDLVPQLCCSLLSPSLSSGSSSPARPVSDLGHLPLQHMTALTQFSSS